MSFPDFLGLLLPLRRQGLGLEIGSPPLVFLSQALAGLSQGLAGRGSGSWGGFSLKTREGSGVYPSHCFLMKINKKRVMCEAVKAFFAL